MKAIAMELNRMSRFHFLLISMVSDEKFNVILTAFPL